MSEQDEPEGVSPEQFGELLRKELREGGPPPTRAPEKPVRPEVQQDLDALLASIQAGLKPRRDEGS